MTSSNHPDTEIVERPVQSLNSGRSSLPDNARWDDLRIAVVLDEARSFRRAADEIGLTINTVRARLDRLEGTVGLRLFRRSPKGVAPTPAGEELIATVRRIRKDVGGLALNDSAPLVSPGEVRIGASETLGVLVLMPRLRALQDRLSGCAVHLSCAYDLQKERRFEVDVEVGFRRSENPDMICARLATLHFMLFTSERYVARHGAPQSLGELTRHRFIEQIAPGINSHILDFLVGTAQEACFTPLRTNSGVALTSAIERGEGIALMPTYMTSLNRGLIALDLPVQLRFDIFLTYAADLRNAPPIVETVAWLRDIFHTARQPWFSEHFVHPRDMQHDVLAGMESGIR